MSHPHACLTGVAVLATRAGAAEKIDTDILFTPLHIIHHRLYLIFGNNLTLMLNKYVTIQLPNSTAQHVLYKSIANRFCCQKAQHVGCSYCLRPTLSLNFPQATAAAHMHSLMCCTKV
jgi:hypothetical protein